MAIKKDFQLSNGVTFSYHRISSLFVRREDSKIYVRVLSYIDKDHFKKGFEGSSILEEMCFYKGNKLVKHEMVCDEALCEKIWNDGIKSGQFRKEDREMIMSTIVADNRGIQEIVTHDLDYEFNKDETIDDLYRNIYTKIMSFSSMEGSVME